MALINKMLSRLIRCALRALSLSFSHSPHKGSWLLLYVHKPLVLV